MLLHSCKNTPVEVGRFYVHSICVNEIAMHKFCQRLPERQKKTSIHPPTHSLTIISIHQYLVLCSLNMRQQNFYTSISLKSARLRNKRLHPNLPPTSLPPQPRPRESQMTYIYREHGLTWSWMDSVSTSRGLCEHQSSIPWPLARRGVRFQVPNIATHMVQEGNWVEDWTGGSSECPWWTVGHKQRGFQNTGGDTFNVCTPGVNSWSHGCELVTSSWYQSILQFWTQTERFSKHTGGDTFTYTWVNSWSQICEFFLLLLVNQYHML